MKKVLFTASSIIALALGQAMASDEGFAAKVAAETNCKTVAGLVKEAITNAGGKAAPAASVASLTGVAVKAKPACACEIVTAAIEASGCAAKEAKATLEALVEAALKASPEQTATIAECATAAAPTHASAIEKVLTKVFSSNDQSQLGDGASKSNRRGKGGKTEVVETKDTRDFDRPIAAIPAPVYLLAPAGGIVGAGDLIEDISPNNPNLK